jgi:predicted Zn-dependent protease
MVLLKKLLIIIVSVSIPLTPVHHSFADDAWQLDEDSAEMSDAEEIELGMQIDNYMKHQFYFDYDPDICEAVNQITLRILGVSDRKTLPFTCDIIRSLSINAFSAPGGHIYLTYGLLRFAHTEDEVAGIVGHEVAHASLRHVSKLYREVSKILSRAENKDDFSSAFMLLNIHLDEFEYDADTLGVLYAYKAGFDPRGLPDFLERHLSFIIENRMFNVLGFSSGFAVRARINHLREYIADLEKKD